MYICNGNTQNKYEKTILHDITINNAVRQRVICSR